MSEINKMERYKHLQRLYSSNKASAKESEELIAITKTFNKHEVYYALGFVLNLKEE